MSHETTYRLLAQSSRPEAIEVLRRGIEVGDATTRRRCFQTLAARKCCQSHEILITLWEDHAGEIREALETDAETKWFRETLTQLIVSEQTQSEERMILLTHLITALSVRDAMPAMVKAAWQHPSHVLRERFAEAVSALSHGWGKQARRQYAGTRPAPMVERSRHELTSQLMHCAQNFQKHRSEDLLDALLALSSWNDSVLRTALHADDACTALILRRLRRSEQQPVMELLAGFLRRKNIPDSVLPLMLQRSDSMYREILLQVISGDPSTVTLCNLKEYGLPDCLRGGLTLLRTLGNDRDAAMAHAYSSAMQQDPETILVLLEILDRHLTPGPQRHGVVEAVAVSMGRCRVPSFEYWVHAFSSDRFDEIVASQPEALQPDKSSNAKSSNAKSAATETGAPSHDIDPPASASLEDRAAEVCLWLVRIAVGADLRFSKLARRLLRELSIDNSLPKFPSLDAEQRLRMGQVLMQIDSETLDVVRDGLRHAVMLRRLEAMEFAQTLGLVDLLIEPFTAIIHNDHQRARLAAAEALGTGTGAVSASLLHELTTSPLGSLRDAAKSSLSRRGITQ